MGFFDQPTPGGTANVLSCQNHGDILSSGNWEGDKKHGANDVAGILGKVVMADGTNDYLRINIVDCVNGDVTMQCESLAAASWAGWDHLVTVEQKFRIRSRFILTAAVTTLRMLQFHLNQAISTCLQVSAATVAMAVQRVHPPQSRIVLLCIKILLVPIMHPLR